MRERERARGQSRGQREGEMRRCGCYTTGERENANKSLVADMRRCDLFWLSLQRRGKGKVKKNLAFASLAYPALYKLVLLPWLLIKFHRACNTKRARGKNQDNRPGFHVLSFLMECHFVCFIDSNFFFRFPTMYTYNVKPRGFAWKIVYFTSDQSREPSLLEQKCSWGINKSNQFFFFFPQPEALYDAVASASLAYRVIHCCIQPLFAGCE